MFSVKFFYDQLTYFSQQRLVPEALLRRRKYATPRPGIVADKQKKRPYVLSHGQ
jgi:hypothetical protein